MAIVAIRLIFVIIHIMMPLVMVIVMTPILPIWLPIVITTTIVVVAMRRSALTAVVPVMSTVGVVPGIMGAVMRVITSAYREFAFATCQCRGRC